MATSVFASRFRSFALLAGLLAAGSAGAQTITAVASGNWGNSTTWSGGTVPGAGNAVSISGQAITLDGNYSVGGLDFGVGSVLSGANRTLTIAGPITLDAAQTNASEHLFASTSSATITLISLGATDVFAAAGVQEGLWDQNSGTARWKNLAGATFTLHDTASLMTDVPGSVFTNAAGANFTHTGTGSAFMQWTMDNAGTVEVQAGGSLTFGGPVVQDNGAGALTGGQWTVRDGATLLFAGSPAFTTLTTIAAGATVTLDGANADFAPADTVVTNNGTINLLGGRAFTVANNSDFTNNGNLTVSGANSTLIAGGNLLVGSTGNGNLTVGGGGAVVVNGVLVLSGNSVSSGTLNLNSGGTLEVGGAGGLVAGNGRVNFNWFGGTLQVVGSDLSTPVNVMLTDAVSRVITNNIITSTVTSSTLDTNGFNATLSGNLTGGGGLIKAGAGTLTLTAANTYNGTTTLSAGALAYGVDNALPTATKVVVASDATLNLASFNGTIGQLVGSGNVSLGSGIITVNLQSNGILFNSIGGSVAVDNSPTDFSGVISGPGPLTVLGIKLSPSSGLGALSFGLSQPLVLSGANTFTGGVALNGGTLTLAAPGALGTTGPITFGGGLLQFSANNTVDYSSRFSSAPGQSYYVDTNGQSVTFATALSSAGGSLTKAGSGTLALTAVNTYTGGTTVQGGTLRLGVANALPSTGTITLSGGTLDLGGFTVALGTVTSSGIIANGTLMAGSLTLQAGTVSANLTGPGSLTVAGSSDSSGVVYTYGPSGPVTLSGLNTYTGSTNVNSGTLVLSGGAAISDASDVHLKDASYPADYDWGGDGAILVLRPPPQIPPAVLQVNTSETIGSLSGGSYGGNYGGGVVALGNGTVLTVGANNANTVYAGSITGGNSASGLTKVGTGTLTLTGGTSYAGSTSVASGTLALSTWGINNVAASSLLTLGSLGHLDVTGLIQGTLVLANNQTLAGTGQVSGKIAASSGLAHLAPGGSGGVGTLTLGSLALSSHLAIDLDFADPSIYDTIAVTDLNGLSLVDGGLFNFFNAGANTPFTGTGSFNLITFNGSLADPNGILATLTASSVLNASAGRTYAFGVTGGSTLTLTIGTQFQQWQTAHFVSTGAVAAQNVADPDHDGLPNLLEYALGSNPLVASTAALPVPALAINPADGLPHLTLTANLNPLAGDVVVDAEVSSDLQTWNSGPLYTEVVSDTTNGNVRTLIIRDKTPSTAGVQRFIRLRVTSP